MSFRPGNVLSRWMVVSACLAAAAMLAACGGSSGAPAPGGGPGSAGGPGGGRRGGPAVEVKVTTVQRMSIQRVVDLAGTLLSPDQAKVSSEVAGVVKQVLVELGTEVKVGQPLVRLEPRELELALARAESALRQTYAQLGMHANVSSDTPPPPDEQVAAVRTAIANLEDAKAAMARADALAARLKLTYADRMRPGITTIGACDLDKAGRTRRRKERKRRKDRQRAAAKRAARGTIPRTEYLARSHSRARPWATEGISRRTWERRRRKATLNACGQRLAVASMSPSTLSYQDGDGLATQRHNSSPGYEWGFAPQ